MRRGALIVFEGVDRCGKSTQTKILLEKLKLKGISVELLRFPDRTTGTGKIIDSYLRNGTELDDRAIHLLFSANRWEAAKPMLQKLEAGTTLIVDRYAFSGVCFTAAKPNLELDWCKASDIGLPEPDVVIFLDLPIAKASLRGEFGDERYEKKDFQQKVYNNFKKLISHPKWKVIDASQTIEEIANEVEAIAEETINSVDAKEIGKLWK